MVLDTHQRSRSTDGVGGSSTRTSVLVLVLVRILTKDHSAYPFLPHRPSIPNFVFPTGLTSLFHLVRVWSRCRKLLTSLALTSLIPELGRVGKFPSCRLTVVLQPFLETPSSLPPSSSLPAFNDMMYHTVLCCTVHICSYLYTYVQ